MSMFQKSVINKYLVNIDQALIETAYQAFKSNYSSVKIEQIKRMKEEEYQDGFLRDLFVKSLGYTLKPDDNFNLVREFKNQTDGKKADGAILKDGNAIAVIELKSTKTKELKSITEQAFNYKNNQPECKYVVTSNFQKLRFYIDHSNEYIEFNLFNLPKEEFEVLYLVLSKASIFSDTPIKLKTETIFQEENISKQFYKDYSSFKNKLFENLVKNNPENDKLTLFKKSQKLIDRFLFILFAEDRGLLPPNLINSIIQRYKILEEQDFKQPIYDIYKQFFGYLNTGHTSKKANENIPAYNGGLFYPDEILDKIIIDDETLITDLQNLSSYDFNTEVDVNILGHIFEHSLAEIEEITAELEGVTTSKTKSKRKKDGVFYTPKYITQYIVENTIGRLCTEKRTELELADIEIDEKCYLKSGKLSGKGKKLYSKIENYKSWLLSLKIVDPACGSGAFLNQALSFLIEEHQFIIDLETDLNKGQISLFNIEKAVLENNLYGVDINEESIEIAKLSLWLRTAQKGRKLSVLSNNIKCGNSLIGDPEIAGDKAFNWQKEFTEVFVEGGFDIVIGNPPYGAKIAKNTLSHLVTKQELCGLNKVFSDTYISFYITSLEELLKNGGLLGFITPNTWRLVLKGATFRTFLSKGHYSFLEIIQHQESVFSDATVDCDTVFLQKKEKTNPKFNIKIRKFQNELFSHSISQELLSDQDFFNLFLTEEIYLLKQKIVQKSISVKDCLIIKNGVKPYEKGKGKPPQTAITMKDKPFTSISKIDNSFSPLIGGSSFHRYKMLWNDDYWIKYGEWLAAPRDEEIFKAPAKLIFRQTGDSIIGTYVDDKFIMRDNTHILLPKNDEYNLKFILAILNSKISNFIYWTNNPEKGEALAQVKLFHLGLLCFPKLATDKQSYFIERVNEILKMNEQIQLNKNKFINRVKTNFNIIKLSRKINLFYEYSFESLLNDYNGVGPS